MEIDFQIDDLFDIVNESGFEILNIKSEHAIKLKGLEDYHNAPFDRMLLSQSIVEPLHLITADSKMAQYSANIIKV